MTSNTNFTYTKVNIVDPMFKTTFGTMEIPTGWRYTPNIIWNFPNKNIVIYIMAESPDKTESFTILPFAFGLHYVSADTEYFSQIQMLQQQIFNFRILRETNQPSQKVEQSIKLQINKKINSYKAIGVTSLAHYGQYTYRSATISGKLLPELSKKIQQIQVDKNWLKLKDLFFSQKSKSSSQKASNTSSSWDKIAQTRKEINEIYRSINKNASESQDRIRAMYHSRTNGTQINNNSQNNTKINNTQINNTQNYEDDSTTERAYKGDYNYMYAFERDDGTVIRTNSSLFDPDKDFNYSRNWRELPYNVGDRYMHTYESDDGTIVQTNSSILKISANLVWGIIHSL